MIFQILLIIFAAFAIMKTSRQYQARKVTVRWFGIWILLWITVIGVAITPESTDIVAELLGVERGADLLVYVAVVVLCYAMYRVFVRLEKQNRELTDLVRKIAINSQDNKRE